MFFKKYLKWCYNYTKQRKTTIQATKKNYLRLSNETSNESIFFKPDELILTIVILYHQYIYHVIYNLFVFYIINPEKMFRKPIAVACLKVPTCLSNYENCYWDMLFYYTKLTFVNEITILQRVEHLFSTCACHRFYLECVYIKLVKKPSAPLLMKYLCTRVAKHHTTRLFICL